MACLVLKIRLDKKEDLSTFLYRSPSQIQDKFENFCTYLNLVSSSLNALNPSCSLMLRILMSDFNLVATWQLLIVLKGQVLNVCSWLKPVN